MTRKQGRLAHQIRTFHIEPNYLQTALGSAFIRAGNTWVLCTASIENKVPPFLLQTQPQQGWLTAEYSMLPGSGTSRVQRAPSGRSKEIERLIGRSLRAAVDLSLLGLRTITIDCDVIQADGGTRTAAITGGYIAMALAIRKGLKQGLLSRNPIKRQVAAISVGMVKGEALLDLDYEEDSQADVDMNIVMAQEGIQSELRFVEIQGTGEQNTFTSEQMKQLCEQASFGIAELIQKQKEALAVLPSS